MARSGNAEVRDLPLHPDEWEIGLEETFDAGIKLAYGVNAGFFTRLEYGHRMAV
jgi:hypothetical protein